MKTSAVRRLKEIEETLKSYDPMAYYVNNLIDIGPEVVRVHKEKNDDAKESFTLGRTEGSGCPHMCQQALARLHFVRSHKH